MDYTEKKNSTNNFHSQIAKMFHRKNRQKRQLTHLIKHEILKYKNLNRTFLEKNGFGCLFSCHYSCIINCIFHVRSLFLLKFLLKPFIRGLWEKYLNNSPTIFIVGELFE